MYCPGSARRLCIKNCAKRAIFPAVLMAVIYASTANGAGPPLFHLEFEAGASTGLGGTVQVTQLGNPILSNDTPTSEDGEPQSLEFDGLDDCLNIGLPDSGESIGFTLVMWIQNLGQSDDFARIVGFAGGGLDVAVAMDDKIRLHTNQTDWVETGQSLPRGVWTHVALRYDGAKMTGFINGIKRFAITCGAVYSRSFCIGAVAGDTKWNHFTGRIDDPAWYAPPLDEVSIQILSGSSLVGHWKLCEGAGRTVYDWSGHEHEGQLMENTTWVADLPPILKENRFGIDGKDFAVHYEGPDSAIEIPSAPVFDTGEFTFTVWVKPTGEMPLGGTIYSRDEDSCEIGVDSQGFIFIQSANTGKVLVGARLELGKWAGLALVSDGRNASFHLDGALTYTISSPLEPKGSILLGNSHRSDGKSGFSGLMSDARYYCEALSAEAVSAVAREGSIPAAEAATSNESKPLGTAVDRTEPVHDEGSVDVDGTVETSRTNLLATTFLYVDLVGYWPLDEGEGTETDDASGAGLPGVLIGKPTWSNDFPDVVSENHSSIFFDGEDDLISIEPGLFLSTLPNDFSFAAWIRPEPSQGFQNIVSRDGQYSLSLEPGRDGRPVLVVGYYAKDREFVHLRTRKGSDLTGKWHHVIGQRKHGSFSLYVDGRLVESGVSAGSSQDMAQGSGNLKIGSGFTGGIDDVRIYNRSLSDAEALRLASLVGHWKLDEGQGRIAFDSSGRNNDGRVDGLFSDRGVEWSGWSRRIPSILFGDVYSFCFDGEDDQIEIPNNSAVGLESFTLSFWVHARPSAQEHERTIFLSFRDSGFSVGMIKDGSLCFSTGEDRRYESDYILHEDTWTHLAFLKDGNRLTFLVDGREIAGIESPVVLGGPMRLGNGWNTEEGSLYRGRLDDVQVYDRPLLPEELSLTAHPFDFGTTQNSLVSPGWVEGSVPAEAEKVMVSLDYGDRFGAVRESATRWFADNHGNEGNAMGVDLFEDRPTYISIAGIDKEGHVFRSSKSYYWISTNLAGKNREDDTITIRRGDSLLFVVLGLGEGNVEIDAMGDGRFKKSGRPSDKFPTLYPYAGSFVARALFEGNEVGTLSVNVVDVDLSEPIACGIYFKRKKDVGVFPESAVSEVAFARNDPSLLNVEFVSYIPDGMQIRIRPHQITNTGVVQARLYDETGPIIAQRNVDVFRIIEPGSADGGKHYPDKTWVKKHVIRVYPVVPGLTGRFVSTTAMGSWMDSTRILDVSTDDLEGPTGEIQVDMLLHKGEGAVYMTRFYQGDTIIWQ